MKPESLNLNPRQAFECAPDVPSNGRERVLIPEGRCLLADGNGNAAVQEKFHYLAHRLRALRRGRPLSKVVVTSPGPGDGKTVVSLNLAAALARKAVNVLLLDADVRHSGLESGLELEPRLGLADLIESGGEIESALCELEPANVSLLPAGRPKLSEAADLFQNARLAEVLRQAEARFDWVILDAPPLNLFADAHCLASLCDAVVLVARAGVTPRAAFEDAWTSIAGTFVAAVVLNGIDESSHGSYYYSGYNRRH